MYNVGFRSKRPFGVAPEFIADGTRSSVHVIHPFGAVIVQVDQARHLPGTLAESSG